MHVQPKQIASRGLPSKKSIQLEYDKLPVPLNIRWEYNDVLQLIFPEQLQKAQYEIASKLIKLLKEKIRVRGQEVSEWAINNNIPNSTLRNLVIPKLIRTGLIVRERINPSGQTNQDKRREMVLTLSSKFGNMLIHIGKEWNYIVDTARFKLASK